MAQNDTINVTAQDAVHAGITLGLGVKRTLAVYRELGGAMREQQFHQLWDREVARFKQWAREQPQT